MQELMDMEIVSMELIRYGGNVRKFAYDALKHAREGKFRESEDCLKKAEEEFKKGYESQNRLLQSARGDSSIVPDLLFIHANSHLMTARAETDLIYELVHLYHRICHIQGKDR